MAEVKINFSDESYGRIRPLHGVNSGPVTKVFTYDARPQFREAGFPYARLHDIEYPYGSGEFVDIHCIFKNFDADENDPASYNFGLTDKYLEETFAVGCEPLFRLGESIEHAPVKMHIFPPRDYLKWARICEHIIRHYTEGWAEGYHWKIDYWEIWNEADGESKKMWQGTPEEFYEFYDVTATYLKGKFPHLKIGGCAFCRAIKPFMDNFLKYISTRDHKVPLDFYSWHRYFADIDGAMLTEAKAAREMLNKYGFDDTESVFDEWNYMEDWSNQPPSYRTIKNEKGAAFCAGVLCALQQETDVTLATYFEADVVKEWCGLFDVKDMSIGKTRATVRPLKPFYAFRAFNELYRLGDAVEAVSDTRSVKACAARGDGKNALLISNCADEDTGVVIELAGLLDHRLEVRLTDETHTFARAAAYELAGDTKIILPMKANAFAYIGSVLE